MKDRFLEIIKQKILLFDGGMGTELYNKGIFINRCYDELNLTNPELVREVHSDYLKAGADIIETNSFGANYFKLSRFQLEDRLYEINFRAAQIAREAAGSSKFVAGAVGPLGVQMEPLGPLSREEVRDYFRQQLQALLDGGVDLFIFETFIYPDELQQAVIAAREISGLPVIAQMTIDEDTTSLTGTEPEIMIKELEEIGADIIGINCTVGPQVMLNWLEKVRPITNYPISVMPNAGKPKSIDGRNIYLTSPEYLGEYAKHYISLGANVLGGCCGTTPAHIRRMRAAIDSQAPNIARSKYEFRDISPTHTVSPLPRNMKSRLARRISEGNFVKFVELLAPKGVSAESEIRKARELNYSGIDVINIPDGPRASARMSAIALAVQIQKEVGIETVLHYVCRDLNVIGIQSGLLGAYALGIKNILAITGDPPKLGNYPDATGVFDVDSIGLINIISRLNNGLDISGAPIGEPSGFFVGCGANPGAINLDEELHRLHWKIDAGAEYIITQPVFDINVFEYFIRKVEQFGVPVIAGLWPLTSLRNAEFMNNEVPGCIVPEFIMDKFRSVEPSKEVYRKIGIEIAAETLDTIKPMIAGVQVSAPFGNIQSVLELLQGR